MHEHNGKNMQVLDDEKTADDAVGHLPRSALVVEHFFNGNVPVLLWLRRGRLHLSQMLDLGRVLVGALIHVVGKFLFCAGDHPVLAYHFDDTQVLAPMVIGLALLDTNLSHNDLSLEHIKHFKYVV